MGVVEDGVEAARGAVGGVVVPAGEEDREARPVPIEVHREFEEEEMGGDVHRTPRHRVVALLPEGEEVLVGEIHAPDVAVPREAEIEGIEPVRVGVAQDGRPHGHPVAIAVAGGIVPVPVERALEGVTEEDEVLPEEIGDEDELIALLEGVQFAVGVLLQHVEGGEVSLPAVVVEVEAPPDPQILVEEEQAAKIGDEGLDPHRDREEVVVGGEIHEVLLEEGLLEADVAIPALGPLAHVDVDGVVLLDVEVADVEHRREPEDEVGGLEGGVPLLEFEGEEQVLVQEELATRTEEGGAAGARGGDGARGGRVAQFDDRVARHREDQEEVLPEDRVVPLEHVLTVGVGEPTARVGAVGGGEFLAGGRRPVPARQTHPPAVGHREKAPSS
ncbi:MAG: hypothetical protein HC813_03740 [Planctomycetes bacterium]|nr:hypothetical protein [Planctomycetota bacterium]